MAEIRLDIDDADGGLPDICMVCGDEAELTKTKKMSWYPPWIGYLWLAGGPILVIILAAIMTKRATVQAPLCEKHKGHWLYRTLIIIGSAVVIGFIGLVILVAMMALDQRAADTVGPFACVGGLVLFIAWIVILVICQNTAIRPKEITNDEIILAGVAQEFVDAVDDIERKRRAKRKKLRQMRDEGAEEEEDEPPLAPRKKAAGSEAIVEKKRRVADEEIEEAPRPRKKRPPADDDE